MTQQELKDTRLSLGLSQAQLADALGVAANTVSRWEQGTLTIQHPKILWLALRQLEIGKPS